MTEPVAALTGADVGEFLASAEPAGRRDDGFALKALMDEITNAPAEMWGPSMVGYGEMHYKYASGHEGDMFVVGFSPRKANLVLYGLQIPENEELLAGLGPVKFGVSCIWAGRLDKLDLGVLTEAVRRAWAQPTSVHPLGHVFTRIR